MRAFSRTGSSPWLLLEYVKAGLVRYVAVCFTRSYWSPSPGAPVRAPVDCFAFATPRTSRFSPSNVTFSSLRVALLHHIRERPPPQQVHNRFFAFKKDGTTTWEFEGKTLLKGETDGSSFPNGGLRATHTAGSCSRGGCVGYSKLLHV